MKILWQLGFAVFQQIIPKHTKKEHKTNKNPHQLTNNKKTQQQKKTKSPSPPPKPQPTPPKTNKSPNQLKQTKKKKSTKHQNPTHDATNIFTNQKKRLRYVEEPEVYSLQKSPVFSSLVTKSANKNLSSCLRVFCQVLI